MTTLHVMPLDKFVPNFISFLNEQIPVKNQKIITFGDKNKYPFELNENHTHFGKYNLFFYIFVYIKSLFSNKVVFHSLLDIRLVCMLLLNPWLLKKSYWVIWGGDLYCFKSQLKTKYWCIKEFIRRPVLKNIPNAVTNTDGDIALLKKWYKNSHVKYHKCLVYPSNIFSEKLPNIYDYTNKKRKLNLLVGNSGIVTNNHKDIFDWLKAEGPYEFDIYCPLSYGQKDYIEEVIKLGESYFDKKFYFNKNLISFKEYIEFLSTIDICVFNHERQQGFGNCIQLLALGKTVFMNSRSPLFHELTRSGLKLKKTKEDAIEELSYSDLLINQKIIDEKFSMQALNSSLVNWIL